MAQESSLITTTHLVKKLIIGFGVFSIVFMCGQWLIANVKFEKDPVVVSSQKYFAKANDKFGPITVPEIQGMQFSATQTGSYLYPLDGKFPPLPDTAILHEVIKPSEDFLTVINAQKVANGLGFKSNFSDSDANTIYWTDEKERRLDFNKTSFDTLLTSKYDFTQSLVIPDTREFDITEKLDKFSSGLLNTGLKLNYYNTEDPKWYPVEKAGSLSLGYKVSETNTNIYLITFEQRTIGVIVPNDNTAEEYVATNKIATTLNIYGNNPFLGNFYAVVNKNFETPANFLQLHLAPINLIEYEKEYNDERAIYDLITAEEAYTLLQGNQGHLVALYMKDIDKFAPPENLSINEFLIDAPSTTIAYYRTEGWSPYLYPIYLFSGNAKIADGQTAKFIFYVSALKNTNSANSQPTIED